MQHPPKKSLLIPSRATECNMLREADVARGVTPAGGVLVDPGTGIQKPGSLLRAAGRLLVQFAPKICSSATFSHLFYREFLRSIELLLIFDL